MEEKFGDEVNENLSNLGLVLEIVDLFLFDSLVHNSIVKLEFRVQFFNHELLNILLLSLAFYY